MATEKMITVAEKLLEQSQKGGVAWAATADERTFSVSFPESSVSISVPVRNRGVFGPQEFYRLAVHNETGSEADALEVDLDHTSFNTLKQLFGSARRKALHTDEVLDDLLSRLGS